MSLKSSYFNCRNTVVTLLLLACCKVAFAATPTMSVAFSPSTIAPGSTSRLTVTIDNSANTVGVSEAAMSTTLPTGMTLLAAPSAVASCPDGTFVATGGGNTFSISGYRIGKGITCTFEMDVTSSTAGTSALTTGSLSSSEGTSGTANANLTVDASRPGFSMAFSPSSVQPNQISTLTYTIDNSLNGSNVSLLKFDHELPTGLLISGAPNAVTNCGGVITAAPGTSDFETLAMSVSAGASCTLSVDVVSAQANVYNTTTGELTQNGSNSSGPASAQLSVVAELLQVSFPNSVTPGQSASLSFNILNTDRNNDISDLTFTVDLNAALSGLSATALPASGFCGSGSAISGSSNLTISGANITTGSNCSFSVTVLVPANAAAGNYTLTTSTINLTRGSATTSTAVTANLQVVKAPTLTLSFIDDPVVTGSDVTARFVITNTDTANAASAITFDMDFNSIVPGLTVKTLPPSNSCGTGSSFSDRLKDGSQHTQLVRIQNGALAAGANCTYDIIFTVGATDQPGSYTFVTETISATVNGSTLYGGTATDTLVVASAPLLSLAVVEESTVPGSNINITFNLGYNANASADATGVGFTLDLDAAITGMTVATLPDAGFCGSGSTISGTSTVTVSGITMAPDGDCEFTMTATVPGATTAGTKTFTTSSVSGTSSGIAVTSASKSDTLVISGLALSHQYLSGPFVPNSTATLRYTITNNANADAATDISFSHNFIRILSGMAATALPSTPCNGSSVMTGSTNLSFSGGELQPGASCSFDVTLSIPANASEGIINSVTEPMSATVNSTNTTSSASTSTLTIETLTALLSTTASSPTATSPIPIAINFSRNVTNFVIADLQVGNGSASNFSGSENAYTADITPTADGAVTVDLAAGAVNDAAVSSHTNTAATQLSVTYEASPAVATPAVAIGSASGSITSSGPITYSVSYTNADEVNLSTATATLNKTGTANGTLTVTNGTTSTPTISISGITGDGTLGVTITPGTSRNGSNSDSGAGPSATFTVDNTAPTVTIVDFVNNPHNAAFPVTITFSEDVTGFTVDDLSFTNASLSDFSATSARVYTVTVTPTTDGSVTGNLAANSAVDAAGNGNTAAPGFGMIYDSTAPTVVVSSANSSVNAPFTATFTFSEDVTGFISSDIAVTNGVASNFATTSASIYTATITPTAEGTVSVDVASSAAADNAGNNSAVATQHSVTYDTTSPTIVISRANSSQPVNAAFTATFTFSESVSGFDINDISVSNANTSNFAATSGSVYTATVTPVTDGQVTVDVSANLATDAASNGNNAATQLSATYDATRPTVGISRPNDTLPVNTAFTATFTFSENISGFAINDIAVSNGTPSNFAATSATVYTATITPNAEGSVTIDVAADSALDSAGNGNVAATQLSLTYDISAPTVAISSDNTSVNAAFTATFTFSENVTGFDVNDIGVNNATVTNFAATSATVYTATITPTNEGTVDIDVSANSATDAAGNNNLAATQYNVSYDTTSPTVSITVQNNLVQSVNTVTFTFSEAVTGFSMSDIAVGNGTVSNFAATSATVYSATVTATVDGSVTIDVAANIANDLAGNGNAAAGQSSFTADATAPLVASTLPIDNATGVALATNLTLTFNENIQLNTGSAGTLRVIQLSPSDAVIQTFTFEVSGGVLSGPGSASISGAALTIDLTDNLLAATKYAVQISSGLIQDLASNDFVGINNNTTFNFITKPGIRLASAQSSLTEETTQQATITASLVDAQGQAFSAVSDVTITLSFTGSTATQTTDYTVAGLSSDAITIANGSSSQNFSITAINDAVSDDNENVKISIASVTSNNAVELQSQQVNIAIVENAVPTLTGLPTSVTLAEDAKGDLDFSSLVIADEENDSVVLTASINSGRVVSPKGTAANVTVTRLTQTSITFAGPVAALNNYFDSQNAIAVLPPLNDVNALTLSITVSDGVEQSAVQAVPITVTAVNDTPRFIQGAIAEFDMTGGSVNSPTNYTETDNQRTITVTLDAGNLLNTDLDTFGGSSAEALYSNTDGGTQLVTVSFDQKVNLESLTYFFTVGSASDSLTFTPTGARGNPITVAASDYTVDDAGTTISLKGWLGITSFTIASSTGGGTFAPGLDTIVYSTPPADFSFQEDVPGALDFSSLSLSDVDSAQLTLKISANSGTLSIPAGRPSISAVSATSAVSVSISNNVITLTGIINDINTYLSDSTNIQYTPASDQNGSDAATVTITVDDSDGSGEVELQSIAVDITAVNDAPTITNLNSDTVSFLQAGDPVVIDAGGNAVAADVDDDNLDAGSLTVTITSGGNSTEDLLSVGSTVTLASLNSGADVTVDSTVIGTLGNAVSEGNDFVVNFNSGATLTRVTTLLNALTFNNTDSLAPSTDDRVISITLNDGENNSDTSTVTLSLTPLDEDSSFTLTSTSTQITPQIDSASEAVTVMQFTLTDSGNDGVATNINQIAFSLGGSLDLDSLSYQLQFTETSGNTLLTDQTFTGSQSNGTLTFSDSIAVTNGSSSSFLALKVYFNNNTNLVDNATLTVSLTPTQNVQTSGTGSQIGTNTSQSNSTGPLSLEVTASKLVFTTEPAGSISGQALTTQPVLEARDEFENLDTGFAESVTVSEFSSGSLTGNTVTAASGVISYSSLSYFASADDESFLLEASVDNTNSTVSNATSNTLISDVLATKVSFNTEPSPTAINTATETSFTTIPVLQAVNGQGLIDTDYVASVTLSETNGAGTAALSADNDTDGDSATVTVAFAAGEVAVSGLSVTYNVAGNGNESFNLLAVSGSLASANSASITANDLPTLVGVPQEIVVVEDQSSALDLSGMQLVDTDGNELTLTLTVTTGTISASSGDGDTSGVTISGSGNASMTLQGSVANLTTFLSDVSELSFLSAINDDTDATLTILANDGQADSAISNVGLSIIAVNDSPVVSGTPSSTVEQGAEYSFIPTSSDVDGDTLTFSIQNQPDWMSFDTSTGQLSGTPGNDDVGVYADIQISVADSGLSTNLGLFSITVENVNDAPTISGTPTAQVNEDNLYSFTPSALDIDGDTLIFSIANLPSWASFDAASGALLGTPGNDDVGNYSGIVVSVSDSNESVSLAAFDITVIAVNDAPVVSGTPLTSVAQNSSYSFSPVVNDVDNNSFFWTIDNKPSWAQFDATTGQLSGTPGATNVGIFAGILITVSDGALFDALPIFSIEVTNINDIPQILGTPPLIALEDEDYTFTPVARDDDGDALVFTISGTPSWASFDTSTGTLAGVPENDDVGVYPNIEISVSDGLESNSLPTFTLTVQNVNDAPSISGVPQNTVSVGNNYLFEPIATDVDSESLSFSVVGKPDWAEFNTENGVLSGTPQRGDVGNFNNIVVSVSDGEFSVSLDAFNINVVDVNVAPTISGSPMTSIVIGENYNFLPQANDENNDTLTFSIVGQPDWAEFNAENGLLFGSPQRDDVGSYNNIVISVSDGEFSVSLDAFNINVVDVNVAPTISGSPATSILVGESYDFLPQANDENNDTLTFSIVAKPDWLNFDSTSGQLSGAPTLNDVAEYSGITISVTDGEFTVSLETFSITVISANVAPVISGTPDTGVSVGESYLFAPVASDDNGDTLTFAVENLPSWLNFDSQTGELSGTPLDTDIGVYEGISISVTDGTVAVALPTFAITVTLGNSAPVAENQTLSVSEDNSLEIRLTATDTNQDELTFRIVQSTSSGTLQLAGDTATYVPEENLSEITDTFTFVANDGQLDSEVATVRISIAPVNDAPEVSGTPVSQVKVLNLYSFTPTATDIDSENLTFSIVNAPTWSSFDAASGILTGTPAASDAGTYGNVTISVSDGELSAQLPPFNIEVLVNSPPVITGSPGVVAEVGVLYQFAPQATDEDADELRFTISNMPSWATFDASSGLLSGTPTDADIGVTDAIVVSATDGINTVSLSAFSIRVCDVCENVAPQISGSPETSVLAGELYEFVPQTTDANDDDLVFSVVNRPSWASFDTSSGRLTGTPTSSDVGVYRNIAMSVSDGQDSVALPTFSVEVLSSNLAPTISGTPQTSVSRGEEYNFIPVAQDADQDDLVFSIVNRPSWASFNPTTGRLRGTPETSNIGTTSNIEIKVTDNINGAVALPTFDIEVLAKNATPEISGSPKTSVTQGNAYSFVPEASDKDGDILTFSVVNLPGWLSFDEQTGALQGTPTENDISSHENIEISVSDGTEQVALPVFTITVLSSNVAPVASDMNLSVQEDKSLNIVASVSDENQDDLTLVIVSPPSSGELQTTQSGWQYTPADNFNGNDTFVYSVSDGELSSEEATVTINVIAVNDKPEANDDAIVVDQVESGTYTLDVLSNDVDVDIETNGDSIALQRVSTNIGSAEVVDNQIQIQLGASFLGDVNLTYSVRDQAAKNDTAKVALTVNGVDDINAPIITVPEDVVVNAQGLTTRVNPGTATAVDAEGNQLPVTLIDDNLDFTPGSHKLYWQAEDSFGSTSTEIQQITVMPVISVASVDSVAEGTSVSVRFILNGDAPSYPYAVNYTVSGTAESGGVDHDAESGTVSFSEGRETSLAVNVQADSEVEANETIIISLNDGQNSGANNTATIVISEENIAPTISLVMEQGATQTSTVAQDAGSVSIVAEVGDPNPQDSVSIDWTSDDFTNTSTIDNIFAFDPSSVTPGTYVVSVYANDDGAPILDATDSITFEVVNTLNVLSETEDTDGDLIPDAQEGYTDSDGDGIPDYLDAIDDCNVIAAQADDQTENLIEADPGVCMRVGETASQNGSNGVQVVVTESGQRASRISNNGERVELLANDLPEDREFVNVGGVFDFVIYDLRTAGQSVRVVLPQSEPIPEGGIYRKYNTNTQLWNSFIINDVNKVFSSKGAQGNCPSPGAGSYTAGLNPGDWCVQLLIEDGGPNDDDGLADARITDPGGVSVFISDNNKPVAVDDVIQISWNTDVEIDVLQNDSDPDADPLVISSADANIGSVEVLAGASLLYVAEPGYSGNDQISYFISDGNGGNDNASVALTIRGNRAPGAVDDFAETDNVTSIEVDVLENDIDVDGDALMIQSASAQSGTVSIVDDNLLLYVPDVSFSGLDVVTYAVADINGATDSAELTIFVDGNEAPQPNNDSIATAFETHVIISVLENDEDPDGDDLFVIEATAESGSVQVNEDSSLTYTPAAGFEGIDTITYTVSDGVLTTTATVTVSVAEKPIEIIDVTSKSGGGALSGLLLLGLWLLMMFRLRERLLFRRDIP